MKHMNKYITDRNAEKALLQLGATLLVLVYGALFWAIMNY